MDAIVIEKQIKELLISPLGADPSAVEKIGRDTPLFGDEGLDLDSLDAAELTILLRARFN